MNSCLLFSMERWWKKWNFHGRRSEREKFLTWSGNLIEKFFLCCPHFRLRPHPFHMFFEVTSSKTFLLLKKLRRDEKWNWFCFARITKFPLPFFTASLDCFFILLGSTYTTQAATSTSILAGALLLKYCSRIACFTIIKVLVAFGEEEKHRNLHTEIKTFIRVAPSLKGCGAAQLKMWIIQIGIKRSTRGSFFRFAFFLCIGFKVKFFFFNCSILCFSFSSLISYAKHSTDKLDSLQRPRVELFLSVST